MASLPQIPSYTVIERIGAGGMGEVYRARDERLERDVAIKLLPDDLTADSDRHERFHREARLLAAFSHPHVAAIHSLEEHEGRHFLVMELVEGEDLGARIQRGRLPVTEALGIARQIAAAMQAAHDKGIVHRDLKPQNVMIDAEGGVKVLDFGLAKLLLDDPDAEPPGSSSFETLPPTMTSDGTRPGLILGTAAYMSPEQARGVPVDRRADVWAFGCVLYAMLTGRTPFPGETVSDTIAAVLKSDPDWSALPESTPPRVRDLLERCLAKDLHGRLRDVGDARIELERTLAGNDPLGESGAGGAAGPARRPLVPVLLTAVVALVAGAAIMQAARGPQPTDLPLTELSLVVPESLDEPDVLLSPDGRTVALAMTPETTDGTPGERRLYLRDLAGSALREVPGSAGLWDFAFSHDGRWLALLTPVNAKSSHPKLSKVPTDLGSPPLELQSLPAETARSLVWLPDGGLVLRTEDYGVLIAPADGSPVRKVSTQSETAPRFSLRSAPGSVLPDGRHLLILLEVWGEQGYRQDVCTLDLETGRLETVLEDAANALYREPGHLLFARGTTLLSVPFDPQTRRTTGGPVALTEGLYITEAWAHGLFELSDDGTLLYRPGGRVGDERQLMLLEPDFSEIGPWSEELRAYEEGLVLSPDGRRLALIVAGLDGVFDTWLGEIDRPGLNLFLDDPQHDNIPAAFSHDGEHLYFMAYGTGFWAMHRTPVAGFQPQRLLQVSAAGTASMRITSVSPDGRWLLISRQFGGRYDILLAPCEPGPDGSVEPRVLLEDSTEGLLSRDGRWLLYETDVSGRLEVCVRRFTPDGTLGPVIRISRNGGRAPGWYVMEKGEPPVIYFRQGRERFLARFDAENGRRIGAPERMPAELTERVERFTDVKQLPDGRIVAIKLDPDEGPADRYVVVLGFGERLR